LDNKVFAATINLNGVIKIKITNIGDDTMLAKIIQTVEDAQNYTGSPLTDFTICLDAIRFENKSNTNPLYGLVAYTIVNSELPIVKNPGTMSLVEFKFATGVTPYV
jgi:hypothetical protein